MKNPRLLSSLLVAAALAGLPLAATRAEEAPTTIKFPEPGKPGTFRVILAHGDLRITGADTQEVAVRSDAKVANKPRKDGLRTLTSSSTFQLSEKENNTIVLDAMADGWGGGSSDFRVTVPRGTSIVVQSAWGGDITCTGISGDIDIKSQNGEIRLDDISGGVAVETMNGEIRANVRELRDNKPLSFNSINGEVVLRVPAEAKANVRLRTQNGAVLTDFDDKVLVTKTETTTRPATARGRAGKLSTVSFNSGSFDKLREQARNLENNAREMTAQAGHSGADADRMVAEAEKMRAEADRMRAEADKAREGVTIAHAVAPPAPTAPASPAPAPGAAPAAPAMPAMPALPTISGGKLVTGTLNGGGPEISISTMNGDVTLRKLDLAAVQKK
jgi:hypothetical protein